MEKIINPHNQFFGQGAMDGVTEIDGKPEAPQRSIPTAQAALAIYRRLRDNNLKRVGTYQKIQGMLDGNPPYNPAKMVKAGLTDMCNVNWKDGEALYRSAALAYWSLFNQVEFIAEFHVNLEEPKPGQQGTGSGYTPDAAAERAMAPEAARNAQLLEQEEEPGIEQGITPEMQETAARTSTGAAARKAASAQNAEYGRILSEEWNRVIRSWPSFNRRMNFHQGELLKFGLNAIIWPDERDWRFTPVSVRDFVVPDETENDIERIDLICIEKSYSARYLWDVYEKARHNPGGVWNADVLGDLLVRLAHVSDQSPYMTDRVDPLLLQNRLRQGDLYYDAIYNDDIRLISIFVKEYDDEKFSHIMIHPELMLEDFLYFNYKQYKNISEAFTYFTFSPGEEKLHSNKGLGHSIFAAVEAITQLDCSLLDQAKRGGSLLLRSNPGRGADDRQVKFAPGGIVDLGECEVAQNTLGANVQAIAETSQYFRRKILENNNISGFDASSADRDAQQATVVQMQVSREARIQRNVISHYYDGLDRFFREIVRKMLHSKPSYPGYEYVKSWKNACIKRGVPEEVFEIGDELTPDGLPVHLNVSATRSAGSGSQAADIMEMQLIMNLLPQLGQRGRIAAMQDYIAAARGWRYKDRYMPVEDRDDQPTGHDTIASLENNQLSDGKQVTVSPDNNHLIHAQNHIRMMQEWMKMFQQDSQAMYDGQPLLQKIDSVYQVAGPHFIKHLLILSQDPINRAAYEQLNAQWGEVANFGNMIANNAQRQRESEMQQQQEAQALMQQQQEMNTPEQIKARGLVQVQDMKARADIQRNAFRDNMEYALKLEKMRNDEDVARRKSAMEIAREAAKLQAEQDLERKRLTMEAKNGRESERKDTSNSGKSRSKK